MKFAAFCYELVACHGHFVQDDEDSALLHSTLNGDALGDDAAMLHAKMGVSHLADDSVGQSLSKQKVSKALSLAPDGTTLVTDGMDLVKLSDINERHLEVYSSYPVPKPWTQFRVQRFTHDVANKDFKEFATRLVVEDTTCSFTPIGFVVDMHAIPEDDDSPLEELAENTIFEINACVPISIEDTLALKSEDIHRSASSSSLIQTSNKLGFWNTKYFIMLRIFFSMMRFTPVVALFEYAFTGRTVYHDIGIFTQISNQEGSTGQALSAHDGFFTDLDLAENNFQVEAEKHIENPWTKFRVSRGTAFNSNSKVSIAGRAIVMDSNCPYPAGSLIEINMIPKICSGETCTALASGDIFELDSCMPMSPEKALMLTSKTIPSSGSSLFQFQDYSVALTWNYIQWQWTSLVNH